jgi:hypothetical protein
MESETMSRVAAGRLVAVVLTVLGVCSVARVSDAQTAVGIGLEHHVVATSKTSTMEKELNDAAEKGFRFADAMGGETAFGGNEVVAVMSKPAGTKTGTFSYRLLATNKTSTMQKELQDASNAGFQYRGQTVFTSAFGGDEVVCILERDGAAPRDRIDYRLVGTSKTGTLEKELQQAGAAGYEVVGMTVGKTAFGGNELVAITRRPRSSTGSGPPAQ